MAPVAMRNNNDITNSAQPSRPDDNDIVTRLLETFTRKEAAAIAAMLKAVDEGAGEMTAVEMLTEKGAFPADRAKLIVRFFVAAKRLASAA